jgi:hypothetical protein
LQDWDSYTDDVDGEFAETFMTAVSGSIILDADETFTPDTFGVACRGK